MARDISQAPIEIINFLNEKRMYFKSLQESIDKSSSCGKLIFHVFEALAEYEIDIIRDRTLTGLAATRESERIGGRPSKLDKNNITLAVSLMDDKSFSGKDVCKALGISKTTLYRNLQEYEDSGSDTQENKRVQ